MAVSDDTFSIFVFLSKKGYSSFLKKEFVFHKICSKVKILRTFKIFTYCHIKACQFFKCRAILKIPSTFSWKNLCSFCWLENETSKKKRFPLFRQKTTQICRKTCWKEQPFIFTVYLMNYIFKTSVLLIPDNGMYRI